jgi:hypothetical protein
LGEIKTYLKFNLEEIEQTFRVYRDDVNVDEGKLKNNKVFSKAEMDRARIVFSFVRETAARAQDKDGPKNEKNAHKIHEELFHQALTMLGYVERSEVVRDLYARQEKELITQDEFLMMLIELKEIKSGKKSRKRNAPAVPGPAGGPGPIGGGDPANGNGNGGNVKDDTGKPDDGKDENVFNQLTAFCTGFFVGETGEGKGEEIGEGEEENIPESSEMDLFYQIENYFRNLYLAFYREDKEAELPERIEKRFKELTEKSAKDKAILHHQQQHRHHHHHHHEQHQTHEYNPLQEKARREMQSLMEAEIEAESKTKDFSHKFILVSKFRHLLTTTGQKLSDEEAMELIRDCHPGLPRDKDSKIKEPVIYLENYRNMLLND